jgi:rod shape-determining protein MreD
MPIDSRIFVFFGANVLLFYLAQLVNNSLSALGLYLLFLGPMIVMPGLYLRLRSAFICILLTGLWIDAACPVPFGLFTLTFLGAGTLTGMLRHRLRPRQSYHPYILTHLFNAGCIFILTISKGLGNYFALELWIQTIITLTISSLCLIFLAPWFFRFQRMLIELFQLDPEPEDLPIR